MMNRNQIRYGKRPRNGQRGAAFILAVLVTFILTVLGLALLFTTTTEIQVAGAETTLNKTFYAADSGSQYGIYQVKSKPTNPAPDTYQQCSALPTYFCFLVPERSTAGTDRTISVQVTPMRLVNVSQSTPGGGPLNVNQIPINTFEYAFSATSSDIVPNTTTVGSTKTISVVTSVGPIPGSPI